MIRRVRFFFSQSPWYGLFWTGAGLVILGVPLWHVSPTWAGVLSGVGGSILATVIVTLTGPAGDEVYQRFRSLKITEFWSDRSKVENDQWVKWLRGAQMRCILLGHSNGEWLRDDGFESALTERLAAGKTVEIFFLDPGGDGAALRQKEDSRGLRDTKRRIRDSIRALWEISERLDPEARTKLTIFVYDSTPSLGVTWIDDWMVVTHYLPGSTNRTAPALKVEAHQDLTCPYAVYELNVNHIRTKSIPLTSANIGRYINE
jgi:hypothetical protein